MRVHELVVGVAAPPSVLRVGLLKVLEGARCTRPLLLTGEAWEGDGGQPVGSVCSLAILSALGGDWEAPLRDLEQSGLRPNRVLVVHTVRSVSEAADLLALNVAGCVRAEDTPECLIEKVMAVAEGNWRRSRSDLFDIIGGKQEARSPLMPLSSGESETLSLLARGYSNRRIAEHLHLAEGTVRNRVSMLYEKIEVRDRGGAILWAWRYGLGPRGMEPPCDS